MPRRNVLRPAPRVLAALAALAALAGCGGPAYQTSNDYAEVHPITVANAPILMAVPATGAITARDGARIDAMGRDYLARGVGRITVAYPNDLDASAVVAAATRRLHAVGVPLEAVRRGAYDPAAYDGAGVVISFDAPVATAPGCPQLWGDSNRIGANGYSGRVGCATQANLAAMIADPRDLIAPRPVGPALSARAVRVQRAAANGSATNAADSTGDASTTN